MKRVILFFVSVLLTMAALAPACRVATPTATLTPTQTPEPVPAPTANSREAYLEQDATRAMEAGQAEVARQSSQYPEWTGTALSKPEAYGDMEGHITAYVFPITKGGEVVGRIVVGSYQGYDILEVSLSAPPSPPTMDRVRSLIERDLSLRAEELNIVGPAQRIYVRDSSTFYYNYWLYGDDDLRVAMVAIDHEKQEALWPGYSWARPKRTPIYTPQPTPTATPTPLSAKLEPALLAELDGKAPDYVATVEVQARKLHDESAERAYVWALTQAGGKPFVSFTGAEYQKFERDFADEYARLNQKQRHSLLRFLASKGYILDPSPYFATMGPVEVPKSLIMELTQRDDVVKIHKPWDRSASGQLPLATQSAREHIKTIGELGRGHSRDWRANWVGAELAGAPEVYYGIPGVPVVYWFEVVKDGQLAGSIAVGSALLDFRAEAYSTRPRPELPTEAQVREKVARGLKLEVGLEEIGQPITKLFRSPESYIAIYSIRGREIAIEPWRESAFLASEITTPEFMMEEWLLKRHYDTMGAGKPAIYP